MPETKRKGARTIKEIPADILEQLNRGEIETANLMEWLAIDVPVLLKNVLRQADRLAYLPVILDNLEKLKKKTINTINETIGLSIHKLIDKHQDTTFFKNLAQHTSDSVRCWAAYVVGQNQDLTIEEKLSKIYDFAADSHFGVRELSWMATRPSITHNLEKSIEILTEWALSKDENIRRFASEITRPRGVWCNHIDALKKEPALALSILEPLKSDSAKYVRDSVGNWLNDVSKTQPTFVRDLCAKWKQESATKETEYILKKALRTLEK